MDTENTENTKDTEYDFDLDPVKKWELEKQTKMLESILGSEDLAKACLDDEFDYALKLRTGEVVRFVGARLLNENWIHIRLDTDKKWDTPNPFPFKADRGVDIRISDIVWVMDAPDGS